MRHRNRGDFRAAPLANFSGFLGINQETALPPFDSREHKARKNWLKAFTFFYLVGWLAIGTLALGARLEVGQCIHDILNFNIWMWVIYHCAYKKKGTGMLMYLLISYSIQWVLITGGLVLFLFLSPQTHLISGLIIGILLLSSVALQFLFWLNCLRLRRINAEARGKNQLAGLKALMVN